MDFKCSFCSLTFRTEYDCHVHIKTVHQSLQIWKSIDCEYCCTRFKTLGELYYHYGTCLKNPYAYGIPSLASFSSDSFEKFEREQLSSTPIQKSSATEKIHVFSCEHGVTTCKSLEECIHNNKFLPIKPENLTHPSLASPSSDDFYKQKFEREQLSSTPIQECSATEKCQVFSCKHCSTKCKSLQELLKFHGVKCKQRNPINLTPSPSASSISDSYKTRI